MFHKITSAPATTLGAAAALALSLAQPAEATGQGGIRDRIEDRIDRRESVIDRQVTLGRRDLIEDRIDARESRRDRLNLPTAAPVRRAERRSWRRLWH